MKPAALWIGALLTLSLLAAPVCAAKPATSPPTSKERPTAGVHLAATLSQITGVAISPMLGVSAIGAYKWWKADTPEAKAALPWYAQPMYWVTGLLIVAAVALKDCGGTVLPPGWKKPLDVAETLENKLSGLVAAGAFIPFTLDTLTSVLKPAGGHSELLDGTGLAMIHLGAIDWTPVLNVMLAPFAIAVFLMVWLTAHAINVLILLSPWGAVDALLKSFRMSVLGLLVVTPQINPWLGILCSAIVIVAAYFLAGWSFRLTTYGTVFCWDFFTFRRHRFSPGSEENWVFAGKKIERVPIRTYGRVRRREDGRLELRYRPWLVLPERRAVLPDVPYTVGRGAFFPSLEGMIGEKERDVLVLPPRYKGHEEAFARSCGVGNIADVGLRRAWGVIKDLLGIESRQLQAPV